jgi:hypothetical protein
MHPRKKAHRDAIRNGHGSEENAYDLRQEAGDEPESQSLQDTKSTIEVPFESSQNPSERTCPKAALISHATDTANSVTTNR